MDSRFEQCVLLEEMEDRAVTLETKTDWLLRQIETYSFQPLAGARLTSLRKQLIAVRLKYAML